MRPRTAARRFCGSMIPHASRGSPFILCRIVRPILSLRWAHLAERRSPPMRRVTRRRTDRALPGSASHVASHPGAPRFDAKQTPPCGAARARRAFGAPRDLRPVRSTAEILAVLRLLLRLRLPLRFCPLFLFDPLPQPVHCGRSGRQVAFYDIPYAIGLHLRLSVDNDIPCANDLAPRDLRCQFSGMLTQLRRSLANDLDVSFDGGLHVLVREKTSEINARCCPFNPHPAARDELQIVAIPECPGSHSGTASEYAS